jgi:hypothetical protein
MKIHVNGILRTIVVMLSGSNRVFLNIFGPLRNERGAGTGSCRFGSRVELRGAADDAIDCVRTGWTLLLRRSG